MTAVAPEAPATTYHEHVAAENAARVLAADAELFARRAARHYLAMARHMDPTERDALRDDLDTVTDLAARLNGIADTHRRAAERIA